MSTWEWKQLDRFARERLYEEHAVAEFGGDPVALAHAQAKMWMFTTIMDQLGPDPVRGMSVGERMRFKKPWTRTLKFLLSAYREHPDYLPEWAPIADDYQKIR